MRLDHLLSREKEVGAWMLSIVGLSSGEAGDGTKRGRVPLARLERTPPRTQAFWWRRAQGKHPYPSRTRRLRPGRPMILCWRRHGKAGGCRIFLRGCSSVGRAPALQAGGQEFESLHLHLRGRKEACASRVRATWKVYFPKQA